MPSETRDHLAEHLKFYGELGVDGFRRESIWRSRADLKVGTTVPGNERGRAGLQASSPDAASDLSAIRDDIGDCTRCKLCRLGRKQIVFGIGNPNADLMFVGEAPGRDEDLQGIPFVGRAGQKLTQIIEAIGLRRDDVYIANVIKCRPPGNRDPVPDEKEACEPYLFRQVELIRPKVIATLGNHATKQLSGKETGITRVHGQEQELKVGSLDVLLYPLYHPAAALYTPAMLTVLEQDFARLPGLLGSSVAASEPAAPQLAAVAAEPAVQLGLF